jgi:hypothetical protein
MILGTTFQDKRNSMKNQWNWLTLFILLLLLGLSACNSGQKITTPGGPKKTNETGQQSIPVLQSTAATIAGDVKDGEQLYFRAVDLRGNNISYTGGPAYGGMMRGSYLTCASCHGPAAHGGKHVMMMGQEMDASPIYYDALAQMAQKDAGKSTYTLDDFHKAVIQGQDIDSSALSQDMPRWQMSDQDLIDLFAFLKTIH